MKNHIKDNPLTPHRPGILLILQVFCITSPVFIYFFNTRDICITIGLLILRSSSVLAAYSSPKGRGPNSSWSSYDFAALDRSHFQRDTQYRWLHRNLIPLYEHL
ncbi:unnamed protein product [Eretmochelys imbricata]